MSDQRALHSIFIQSIANYLRGKLRFERNHCILGPICEEGMSAISAGIIAQNTGESVTKTLWIEVSDPRYRECLHEELKAWGVESVLWQQDESLTEEASKVEILQDVFNDGVTAVIVPSDWQELECPPASAMTQNRRLFRVNDTINVAELCEEWKAAGYDIVSSIDGKGQFALRKGVLDVFLLSASSPVRIEFAQDTVKSLRIFDAVTQVSVETIEQWDLLTEETDQSGFLGDYVKADDLIITQEEASQYEGLNNVILSSDPTVTNFEVQASPFTTLDPGDFVMQDASHQMVQDYLEQWREAGWQIVFASGMQSERDRFFEIMGEQWRKQAELVEENTMHTLLLPEQKFALISLSAIFGRYQAPRKVSAHAELWQTAASRHAQTAELNPGELVVHAEYGVGELLDITYSEEQAEELIQIQYDKGAILEVPMRQSHLVAKYVGVGTIKPKLSKLGDARWAKLKEKAVGSVMDYAARMLRVQAERAAEEGTPHPPDSKWMWEFESSFPYQETPDQLKAIDEAKRDMESPYSMDRLICGDVGFGKTEVAIRAAFKAVCGGFQVAILAPTTVLAEQHHRTFCERMSAYPVRVDLLNRFRKPSEARSTVEGLADGSVDIVIGTHRVLSDAVTYNNLGLVVIDEEQRFGVKHKEKFKERFNQIDMLTLSATPIPRTLYLSLMGARDMSVLNTPPLNRNPVQTQVLAYDERLIKRAVERELARGGQVYFLHNRVKTIHSVAEVVQRLVPSARVVVGHGQMERDALEDVMHTFVEGRADVLLATTIIESGIDIPNANTILIDRADLFGLSDLYQLRGRVGRADRQAYAYLLLPKKELFSSDAKKRVSAIKQFTALGSGFKIAMRDLEIRGAGNLLGTKQSGHIAAVGFDLYCQLLKESIAKLKGERASVNAECSLRLDFVTFAETQYKPGGSTCPAYIPKDYISDGKERLAAYRRLSLSESLSSIKQTEAEWRDRYGKHPTALRNLFTVTRIKLFGALSEVDSLEVKGERVMISRKGGYITLAKGNFPRLEKQKPNPKLVELENMMKDLSAGV